MKIRGLSLLVIGAMIMGMIPVSTPSHAQTMPQFSRIYGDNRFDTAIKVSENIFVSSENAIISSGENYPDGLAGGVLASVMDAPLLLTAKGSLYGGINDELKRINVKTVYLLGGEGSISKNVEQQLQGYNVIRLGGKNRYETASIIAKKVNSINKSRNVGIAGGGNFADALSSTAMLSRNRVPLLLTERNRLPQETRNYMVDMGINNTLVFGGENSVSTSSLRENSFTMGITRFSGKTRFETSYDIALKGFANTDTVLLVNGENFPDALAAAPYAKKNFAPILLGSKLSLSDSVLKYVSQAKRVVIIGGEDSIDDSLLNTIVQYRNSNIHKVTKVLSPTKIAINYFGKEELVNLNSIAFPEHFSNDQQVVDRQKEIATKTLSNMILGKNIILEMDISQRDEKQDLLAYVYLDGDNRTMINEEMIKKGLVKTEITPPNAKYLDRLKLAEETARTQKVGIWQIIAQ